MTAHSQEQLGFTASVQALADSLHYEGYGILKPESSKFFALSLQAFGHIGWRAHLHLHCCTSASRATIVCAEAPSCGSPFATPSAWDKSCLWSVMEANSESSTPLTRDGSCGNSRMPRPRSSLSSGDIAKAQASTEPRMMGCQRAEVSTRYLLVASSQNVSGTSQGDSDARG